MKLLKKTLAILLCLVTVFSVASVSAFAEDTRIEVTEIVGTSNFKAPVYGDEVKTYYNFTFTKGKEVRVGDLMSKWMKWNESTSAWENYNETRFTEGKYKFGTQIRIDDTSGYGTTHKLAQTVTVKIDGTTWFYAPNPTIYSTYSCNYITSPEYKVVKPVEKIVLKKVAITGIDKPVAGAIPDTTAVTDSTFKIGSLGGIGWYRIVDGAWVSMASGEKFEEGNTYVCYMQVLPADGYEFAASKSDFSATINGETATLGDSYSKGLAYVQKEYEIPKKYTVTVINGTASKATATAGEKITLIANAAPEGKQFDKWVVTGATVADETKATTTFVMSGSGVTATATYKDKPVVKKTVNISKLPSIATGSIFDSDRIRDCFPDLDYHQSPYYTYITNHVPQLDGQTAVAGRNYYVLTTFYTGGNTTPDPAEFKIIYDGQEVEYKNFNSYQESENAYYFYKNDNNGRAMCILRIKVGESVDASTFCTCKCHTGNFFFKIILFFQKLFGMNKICEGCGMKH